MTFKESRTCLLILTILVLFSCNSKKGNHKKMHKFGEDYTAAWNSMDPQKMASFYAKDGSLVVNNGTPAEGREQIAETAKSYMQAFPDLNLKMDSLIVDGKTYRYHWTFTGTNSGPGGTGNKVVFSGFEGWTMNENGLIQESIGSYDAESYNKQLRVSKD